MVSDESRDPGFEWYEKERLCLASRNISGSDMILADVLQQL